MDPIDELIGKFLQRSSELEYAVGRIESGKYTGWVGSKSSRQTNHDVILDLAEQNDRFLLFCLASAWSASGPWENAAALIATMKKLGPNISAASAWESEPTPENVVIKALPEPEAFESRKKISFRKDFFAPICNIAKEWTNIEKLMFDADKSCDWLTFIETFRQIEGTAPGGKKILIKMPLILRELRCQNIFHDIPGYLCCVQDGRVVDAIKRLNHNNPAHERVKRLKNYRPTKVENVIKASCRIYELFGDLYDLPLFAAQDLN